MAFRHLSVGHDHLRLRHYPPQPLGEGADRAHAVVDKVRLAAPFHFIQYGFAHDLLGELDDRGLHRLPIAWWCLDDGYVTQTTEREIEGAGNRGRRHRHHVNLGAQLSEPLLLGDTEALLLVEDQQPEVAESNAVG